MSCGYIWYLFIPQVAPFAKHISIISRIANKLALKESHIEAGGVIVDKLEEEHLHSQFVLILQVGLWNFCHTIKKYLIYKLDFKYIKQKHIFTFYRTFMICTDVWIHKDKDILSLWSSPMSVIQTATLSYMRLRIIMMTKLMQEAVTEVASCGVM